MKIAIICFNLFTAGGARLVFSLAQSLQARGERVVIYTPEFEGTDFPDLAQGLEIRVVKKKINFFKSEKPKNIFDWVLKKIKYEQEFIQTSIAIAKAMDTDFDIVNIHDSSYRVGYYYHQKNSLAKIVWTVNGEPSHYLSRKKIVYDILGHSYHFLRKIVDYKFLKIINSATVLANSDKKWFHKFPIKKVLVVRAGLDFTKFYSPVKDFKEKADKKYVKLMALGALNIFRRYENVLEAVRFLREWGYDAHATIFAANVWNENKYEADLLGFIKKNSLSEFVDLRLNGVSEKELASFYRDADIFVQAVYVPPPGHHGWGLVNFEAMAAGLPVVLCRTSTATEVLIDGSSAFFVDPLSPDQIAQKIKLCVDNPDLYAKVALAGQSIAHEMDWEKYTDEMLNIFKSSN
jgi:glycosyltransferase involved in cell wall biosynthesis